MGRTGSKPGTKGRNWPDAERSTIKPGWRLRRATLAEVKALAAELGETEGLTVEALLSLARRHAAEIPAEIARLKQID